MKKKGDPRWWWSMALIQWTRMGWTKEDAEVLLLLVLVLVLLLLVASRRGCSA